METLTPTPLNLLERFNKWLQESVMVKLFSIGFLLLILLIPSSWIQDLIYERQSRAESVIAEITDKWSGSQTLAGPVLVIPYKKIQIVDKGKEGIEKYEVIQKAFFLPEKLDINGVIDPQILNRGIFDAVVYGSTLDVKSVFNQPDFKSLKIDENLVLWNEAYLAFGISDLRGISENPAFSLGTTTLTAEPSNNLGIYMYKNNGASDAINGIISRLNWASKENFNGNISIKLSLKGSDRLDFIPAGKTTSVKLSGEWKDPSFDGEFLPETREITDNGFSSTWKVLHFNRPFAQQWIEDEQQLAGANFGVKLLLPVDQYQKSIRTSKYGVLIILLTFVALLLVEIIRKVRIHPFQYILIGAALTIYYTLLLSFSEHIGYDIAYIISSLATVVLICAYASTFLRSSKLTVLFALLLTIFYTFIFVIIQQQDSSLLLGSVGLFIIISALMYFSRNIRWYKDQDQSTEIK